MARKRPTKTRSRGRFKSLRVSESFRTYALDQLSSVAGLRARPMSMSYFSVPLSVLEASPTLAVWAKRSIAVARSGNRTTSRTRRGNRVRS